MKMVETDLSPEKLNLELNSPTSNTTLTPDFTNVNSNYSVHSEQKQLSATEAISSNLEEHPSTNEISSLPRIHHLDTVTDTSKTDNDNNLLLELENIPSQSSLAQNIPCSFELSEINLKPDGSTINSQKAKKNVSYARQPSKSNKQTYNDSNTSTPHGNSSGVGNKSHYSRSSSRRKKLKKKADFNNLIDASDDSFCAITSDMDQDCNTHSNIDDSNETDAERIVRCVSNIKKLLKTEEDSKPPEENEVLESSEDLKNTDSSESPFKCLICAEKFPNLISLSSHKYSHEKPYSCTDCDSVFASKANLAVHMKRNHTSEKPYSCDECGARFHTQGNLKRHAKTHTGEKPFKCDVCESCFTERKSLMVHLRRHTGERPYQCKVCGKRFAQTGVLQSHMAMHLDLKIHLCELCGKSFRQKSQLRVHKIRHENIRNYGCDFCTAFFLTKGDLQRHFRQHTGEKPYTCDVCGKAFTRQLSLKEHLNRQCGILTS